MKCFFSAFAFGLICMPLLAQVSVPQIGTVRYPDGTLHTVQGIDSNVIVADLPMEAVEAASFSDQGGLVLQDGVIRLLARDFSVVAEYPTAEKPRLALDGELTSAFAWLPVKQALIHWNGSHFDELSLSGTELEGTVTDVQSSGSRQARLIVQHSDNSVSGVTISLRTGNLVSSEQLPGVSGYTVGQSFFVVYASGKDLVVDDLRGYRRNLPLPAHDLVIDRMSNTWLHLYSATLQQNWALHLTQADLQLSMLPCLPEHRTPSAIAVAAQKGIK